LQQKNERSWQVAMLFSITGHWSKSVGKLNPVGTGGPALTCAARDSSPVNPDTTQRLIDPNIVPFRPTLWTDIYAA